MSGSRSKNKAVEVTAESKVKGKCSFCGMGVKTCKEDGVLKSGKFYTMGGMFFHYFCVLFSRDGKQHGEDDEGLFGFFLADIQKELRRGSSLPCAFCHNKRATIHCSRPGCKRQYHFPCGQKHGGVFLFKEGMKSFCPAHAPRQNRRMRVEDRTCLAGCSEKTLDSERILISPCCGRPYHTNCLQQMAQQSGRAHYKCPVCFSKADFLQESLNFGIYVPEQDAAWEKEELEDFYNFTAMGRQHQRCDAKSCLCSKGREYHMAGTDFEIIRCNNCGGQGVHIKCGGLDKYRPDFICDQHGDGGNPVAPSSPKRRRFDDDSSQDESSPPSSPLPDGGGSDSDSSIDDDVIARKLHESEQTSKDSKSLAKKPNVASGSNFPPKRVSMSPESSDSNDDDDIVFVDPNLPSRSDDVTPPPQARPDPNYLRASPDPDDGEEDIVFLEEVNTSQVQSQGLARVPPPHPPEPLGRHLTPILTSQDQLTMRVTATRTNSIAGLLADTEMSRSMPSSSTNNEHHTPVSTSSWNTAPSTSYYARKSYPASEEDAEQPLGLKITSIHSFNPALTNSFNANERMLAALPGHQQQQQTALNMQVRQQLLSALPVQQQQQLPTVPQPLQQWFPGLPVQPRQSTAMPVHRQQSTALPAQPTAMPVHRNDLTALPVHRKQSTALPVQSTALPVQPTPMPVHRKQSTALPVAGTLHQMEQMAVRLPGLPWDARPSTGHLQQQRQPFVGQPQPPFPGLPVQVRPSTAMPVLRQQLTALTAHQHQQLAALSMQQVQTVALPVHRQQLTAIVEQQHVPDEPYRQNAEIRPELILLESSDEEEDVILID